ncbi:MAG TPA: YtxH domain-containing protein [Umezawaea sp.]|nr:YtxH domain-containing protein [Umezawaea sp.]
MQNTNDRTPPRIDNTPPQVVNGQTIELSENIKSGKVLLDPATGEELRKLLREQVEQVDSWLARAGRLARPAPLGANPVSDAMSEKFESRAEGDPYSFVNVMSAYRTVLQDTHDQVSAAITKYQQVDEDHRAALTKLEGI